jgi:hypothetical protein
MMHRPAIRRTLAWIFVSFTLLPCFALPGVSSDEHPVAQDLLRGGLAAFTPIDLVLCGVLALAAASAAIAVRMVRRSH